MILKNFEDDRQFDRPLDKANSVNWVAGHIASARYGVADSLGIKAKCPWGNLYDRGAEVADKAKYPSLQEIKTVWKDISAKIVKGLQEATEEQLSKEPEWQGPGMENSVRGVITFLSFHESYHMGQLGYLRKIHDLDGAFG
jgi:uncharacterized damage-inducible protein DinB